MNCSTCPKPMFVILGDRAFCEECYRDLQQQYRKMIDSYPKRTTGGRDES